MKLLKSLSLYTISGISSKAAGFVLLPIVANSIGTDNLGQLSLIFAITGVVAPLILLSAHGAISVEYFRRDQGDNAFPSYVISALMNPLISFGIFTFVFLLFGKYIAEAINLDPRWASLVPVYCLMGMIPTITSIIYQVTNQPLRHVQYNLGLTFLEMGLALLFVVALKWNYDGRVWSILGSKMVFTGIGLYILYRAGFLTRKLSKTYRLDALAFAIPLIPHHIAGAVVNLSDRIFIGSMANMDELGIYEAGYKVGSVVLVLQSAFALAWMPMLYEWLKQNTEYAKRKIVLYTYAGVAGFLLCAVLVTLLAPVAFYLFNKEYQGGMAYVFWVALGYSFFGWYTLRAGVIFYFKKNIYLTYLAFIKIFLNLIFNYFFIRHFGVLGAAYATALSFLLEFILITIISNRIYPLPWLYFLNKKDSS